MAKNRVQMVEWICDGCGEQAIRSKDEGAPIGWLDGSSVKIDQGAQGGTVSEWTACQPVCVQRAVVQAFLDQGVDLNPKDAEVEKTTNPVAVNG